MNVQALRELLDGMPNHAEIEIICTDEGVYDGPETRVTIDSYWAGPNWADPVPKVILTGKVHLW